MPLLKSVLPVSKYSGSMRQCGKAYGYEHTEMFGAGLEGAAKMPSSRWRFARACSQVDWKFRKPIEEFVRGSAEGAGRTFDEMYQFLCGEELGRMRHCTALGATGEGTKDGKAVIGQNWDGVWQAYPWPILMNLRSDSLPKVLYYVSGPGTWPSAGINEAGLALVWTSASHYLRKRYRWPVTGVPTYALVAGILSCRSCREAVELVRKTPNAGGFIFFIADKSGEAGVIEAVPGHTDYIQCRDVIGRANHLEGDKLVKLSGQHVPKSTPKSNSLSRGVRIAELIARHRGRIDRAAVEAMLRDNHAPCGLTICQSCGNGNQFLTIDSFYCLPAKREFWIARGIQSRHAYVRHTV